MTIGPCCETRSTLHVDAPASSYRVAYPQFLFDKNYRNSAAFGNSAFARRIHEIEMLAIQPSSKSKLCQKCTPNLLPFRLNHDGPINETERFWKPEKSEDGAVYPCTQLCYNSNVIQENHTPISAAAICTEHTSLSHQTTAALCCKLQIKISPRRAMIGWMRRMRWRRLKLRL